MAALAAAAATLNFIVKVDCCSKQLWVEIKTTKDILNGGDGHDGWFRAMDVTPRAQGKKKKLVDGLWKANVVNLKLRRMKFDNVSLTELTPELRAWGACNTGTPTCGDRSLA